MSDRREFFSEQWNGAEFIAKYFKPCFFWYFSCVKKSTIKKILRQETDRSLFNRPQIICVKKIYGAERSLFGSYLEALNILH